MATDEPDIVATDDQGQKLSDTDVKVNGILPGSGGGGVSEINDLDDVDVQALLEGPDADKPAAGTTGRYYYATDSQVLYRDDGSTWIAKSGLGSSGNRPTAYRDTLDANWVSTGEADVTNETFVRPTRGTDSASTSAGTLINAYDGESKDVRSEYNSSAQFSPDQTGEYIIEIAVDIRGSTTTGDSLAGRIQNVTDGVKAGADSRKQAPASAAIVNFVFVVSLDSAKTYELQVTNNDSSFVVKGNENTTGEIVRSVVA